MYEDTKAITGVDIKLKWGQIYPMLVERKVPEVGLGDLALYENILRSWLSKIATRMKIFPCAEVIGWIFPKIDIEISVTTEWVKILKFDYTTTTKTMVAEGNTFRHKQSG